MAIQQKTATVKGTEYLLSSFPTGRGMVVLKQLGQLAGPAVAAVENGGVSALISAVMQNLEAIDVENLSKQIVSGATTKSGMPLQFDVEFSGEYDRLFMLMKEVVEFNYGSVLSMVSGVTALEAPATD
ncbi:phage tail assembly chaperone [Streptomyces microflavus]|uniref:phage tail assembly chaperone n=1 Tax=Streptomyces microflavus TaxID=1919 RepID=UPI00362515CB